jgi:prephenate dehydrogenase
MKDRIGNVLAVGDRVLLALPEAQIFGFVAQLDESQLITGVRSVKGGMSQQPGRVLVSCVVALPMDANLGMVAQLVKVVDPDKHDDDTRKGISKVQ